MTVSDLKSKVIEAIDALICNDDEPAATRLTALQELQEEADEMLQEHIESLESEIEDAE